MFNFLPSTSCLCHVLQSFRAKSVIIDHLSQIGKHVKQIPRREFKVQLTARILEVVENKNEVSKKLMLEKHGWGEVVSITFSVCKSPSWTGKGISGLSLLKSEGQLRHTAKKRYGRNLNPIYQLPVHFLFYFIPIIKLKLYKRW